MTIKYEYDRLGLDCFLGNMDLDIFDYRVQGEIETGPSEKMGASEKSWEGD